MYRRFIKSTVNGAGYATLLLVGGHFLLVGLSMDGHLPYAGLRLGSITVFEIWADANKSGWMLGPGILAMAAVGGLLYATGDALWSRPEFRSKVKSALFGPGTRK